MRQSCVTSFITVTHAFVAFTLAMIFRWKYTESSGKSAVAQNVALLLHS